MLGIRMSPLRASRAGRGIWPLFRYHGTSHGAAPAISASLYIDLDAFKQVKDRFDRDVGDMVLTEMVRCLWRAIRTSDLQACLCGDEFGVILENLRPPGDALKVARHITEAISEAFVAKDVTLSIADSTGAAVTGRGVIDVSNLLARADRMLFAAGTAARGHVALDVQEGARQVDNRATRRGDIS